MQEYRTQGDHSVYLELYIMDNIQGFSNFRNEILSIKNAIDADNYRDCKDKLIAIRPMLSGEAFSREERMEINLLIDDCFRAIDYLRDREQKQFEEASRSNFERIAPMVEEAHAKAFDSEDIREAWDFCIGVQQEFRGVRMKKETRELLYARLQEAFDRLKQRKAVQMKEQQLQSEKDQQEMLPVIEGLVQTAEHTADISESWQQMIDMQQKIHEKNLSPEVRKKLLDKLQDAFTILKIKREQESELLKGKASDNAIHIEKMLVEGEKVAAESEHFREAFDTLKGIQQAFREYALLAEDREMLYGRLQVAFETLKERQDLWYRERDREAIENYETLKPLVEVGLERAQKSMEFKKTRESLKRIQEKFKGIKMRSEDRQSLYSKLQKAFETLNKRHDEYLLTKKEKIELQVNYQLSDVELKIEEIRKEIAQDQSRVLELEESGENPLFQKQYTNPSHDIQNQILVLKAAIAHKEKTLEELLEQKSRLVEKRDKWRELD